MSLITRLQPGKGRETAVARDIRKLCKRADIPYRSPHQLRHTHIAYAITCAKDMADMKAISQNVMHESLMTTESTYGGLPTDAVAARIAALTPPQSASAEVAQDTLSDAIVRKLLDPTNSLADKFAEAVARRLFQMNELLTSR
ncbi:MAG: hypothetical protein JW900_10425 [Anaerolineae bacterium]|nr:hypothetical protein [Anaerolineae bacterium]